MYNVGSTSSTLVQHCTNVIQMFRVYWDPCTRWPSNRWDLITQSTDRHIVYVTGSKHSTRTQSLTAHLHCGSPRKLCRKSRQKLFDREKRRPSAAFRSVCQIDSVNTGGTRGFLMKRRKWLRSASPALANHSIPDPVFSISLISILGFW